MAKDETSTPSAWRKPVKVQKKHIERGQQAISGHCMAAEAIKDAYPEFKHVTVTGTVIRVSPRDDDYRYEWNTPNNVVQALRRFDQKLPIEEFEFRLPVTIAHKVLQNQARRRPGEAPAPRKKSVISAQEGRRNMATRVGGKLGNTGPLSNRGGKVRIWGEGVAVGYHPLDHFEQEFKAECARRGIVLPDEPQDEGK